MLTLLGLVLIGLGVGGLADLGPVRASRPPSRGRLSALRPTTAILSGLGFIVLDLVLALVLIVVLGGSSAGAQEVQVVEVDVAPVVADEQVEPVVVDELESEAVLAVTASGFASDTTGWLVQCATVDVRSCSDRQSVRFDERGRADAQFLVRQQVRGVDASCADPATRCTLELQVGRDTVVVETVFGRAAPPPGIIEVQPGGPYRLGDEITVIASGFPAGAVLVTTVCAQPAVRGDRCGAPAPEVAMVADEAGDASARLALDVARVGADGVACTRRTSCQLVVIADDVVVRARPVPLALAGEPGPAYDRARLVIAMVVAAGLVAAAAALVFSTNWDPPSEADSSAIDDADFADLDREAELFGEEPVPL